MHAARSCLWLFRWLAIGCNAANLFPAMAAPVAIFPSAVLVPTFFDCVYLVLPMVFLPPAFAVFFVFVFTLTFSFIFSFGVVVPSLLVPAAVLLPTFSFSFVFAFSFEICSFSFVPDGIHFQCCGISCKSFASYKGHGNVFYFLESLLCYM